MHLTPLCYHNKTYDIIYDNRYDRACSAVVVALRFGTQGPGFKPGLFHKACYMPLHGCWMKLRVYFDNRYDIKFPFHMILILFTIAYMFQWYHIHGIMLDIAAWNYATEFMRLQMISDAKSYDTVSTLNFCDIIKKVWYYIWYWIWYWFFISYDIY